MEPTTAAKEGSRKPGAGCWGKREHHLTITRMQTTSHTVQSAPTIMVGASFTVDQAGPSNERVSITWKTLYGQVASPTDFVVDASLHGVVGIAELGIDLERDTDAKLGQRRVVSVHERVQSYLAQLIMISSQPFFRANGIEKRHTIVCCWPSGQPLAC